MTRIQRERFASEEDYQAQKNVFVLDKEKLDKAREDMIILHPLPRVNEITVDIDDDPRALYFKQAQYGMYGRMALILLLLQDDEFFVENRPQQSEMYHTAGAISSEPQLRKAWYGNVRLLRQENRLRCIK